MACTPYRDALSALLDGEDPGLGDDELDRHLSACAGCAAFAGGAAGLHRTLRVRTADQVPDLRAAILARIEPLAPSAPVAPASRATAPSSPRVGLARYALAVLGLTMVVLAVPSLLLHDASALHLSRELGAWDAAFGLGLLVAAWQPERARGLLPMAAALAGTMVLAATIDVLAGRAPAATEAHHAIEVAGVLVLWILARSTAPAAGRRSVWQAA